LHACIRGRAGIDALSRERVRTELLKLLLAPHATPTLALMTETGLLGNVLGGVALLASFENMVKVEAAVGGRSRPGGGSAAARRAWRVGRRGWRAPCATLAFIQCRCREIDRAGAMVAIIARRRRHVCTRAALPAGSAAFCRPGAGGMVAFHGERWRSRLARLRRTAADLE